MFVFIVFIHFNNGANTKSQQNYKFFAKIFAKPKNKFYFCTRKRKIGLWCNGNTTDSGPVIPGSNPGSPTRRRLFQVVFFFVLGYQDSFSLSRLGRLVCGCQMRSVAFATVEYRLRNICSNKFGSYSQPIFQTFGFSAHFPPFGLLSASAAVRILLQRGGGWGGALAVLGLLGVCGFDRKYRNYRIAQTLYLL